MKDKALLDEICSIVFDKEMVDSTKITKLWNLLREREE